jgi:hypothetical protein
MTSSGQVKINWRTAEMHEGGLTVELAREPPKGWVKHFRGVLALLEQNAGQWDEIRLSKRRITVSDVREGSEDELRHLLESACLQANADLRLDGPEPSSEPQDDSQAEADQRMAESFRGFAQSGP